MSTEPTPFGAPMLSHFQFDPAFKNLNHGSFGAHPKQIQDIHEDYQKASSARPDPFIRYEQPQALDASRAALAKYLNIRVDECVFVKNATTGVNTVLRNIPFSPGDVIVYFDTVYGGVEKSIQSIEETTPASSVKVEYTFPIDQAELVGKFRDVVRAVNSQAGKKVKIAVFETVVSVPGIRFPVEDLVNVCRAEGVLSLIDAAHAVGMIPVDLGELKPDFWTSNCHKWLFTPRSAAILHIPKKNQHLIRTTLPTSWGFVPKSADPYSETGEPDETPEGTSSLTHQKTTKTRFELLFEFVATTDDSPYLCIPAALDFRARVCGGEERIYGYLDELANVGGDVVAGILGTEVLSEGKPQGSAQESGFRRCAMVNVRLPVSLKGLDGDGDVAEDDLSAVMKWVGETLIRKYGTFVPVFRYAGALWTRLSAQVYLEKSDFEWIGGVLREICEDVKKGVYRE